MPTHFLFSYDEISEHTAVAICKLLHQYQYPVKTAFCRFKYVFCLKDLSDIEIIKNSKSNTSVFPEIEEYRSAIFFRSQSKYE